MKPPPRRTEADQKRRSSGRKCTRTESRAGFVQLKEFKGPSCRIYEHLVARNRIANYFSADPCFVTSNPIFLVKTDTLFLKLHFMPTNDFKSRTFKMISDQLEIRGAQQHGV